MAWRPMAWGPARRWWARHAGTLPYRLMLLRHLWSDSRGWAVCLGLGTILSGLLPPLFAMAIGQVIGSTPAAVQGGLGSDDGQRLLPALAAAIGIYLAQGAWQPVFGAMCRAAGVRVNNRIREEIAALLNLPVTVEHLEDARTVDRVTLAQRTVFGATAGQVVEHQPRQVATWLDGLVSVVVVGTVYSWWVAILLLGTCLATRRPFRRLFLDTLAAASGQVEALRRASYLRDLLSEPNVAAKEVRIFGLTEWLLERFRSTWLAAMAEVWCQRRRGVAAVAVGLLAITCVQVAAAVHLAWAGASGALSLGALSIAAQSMWLITAAFAYRYTDYLVEQGLSTVPHLLAIQQTQAGLHPPRDGLRSHPCPSPHPCLPSHLCTHPHPRRGQDPGERPREAIRFQDVRFTYPGTTREVLRGASLTIRAGRSLAIVGDNGAGKTTLVKLLAGLYLPTEGVVTVDGVPLAELDVPTWQRSIAVIFQDFVRYPVPARDNIAFGRVERRDDTAGIVRAAAWAGAADLLNGLPWGLDTILSREYRRGAELSGGQWQRIALARALFAVEHGARVLILDEPTANLDARAEAETFEALLEQTAGLTTILISHRFSSVRRAQRICVLHQGRVIEEGSHDELMALRGEYARMFTLQASLFAGAARGTGTAGGRAP
ncbi:MAG TPA: ABC transporter ATP-binding protein [Chloroflexota bacterium]|nr:ABC transporter ATP-binding protein [Chloroflexota bacterium]